FSRKDGSVLYALVGVCSLPDACDQVVMFIVDISKQKEAEMQIHQLNMVLQERVSEAALARDLAMESAVLKSQFVKNISHELLTSFTSLIGMSEFLLETNLDGEQRLFTKTIYDSGKSLYVIIKNLVDFASLEAGEVELVKDDFCPHELLKKIVEKA